MGHYEERLSSDLKKIEESVSEIENKVINAVDNSVKALLSGDSGLAYNTVIDDHEINRMVKEVDTDCLHFIATHIPTGMHLRVIHATMRVLRELERIGDYASTICRETMQLSKTISGENIKKHLEEMSAHSQLCLNKGIEAFKKKDEKLATEAIILTNQSITHFNKVYEDLIENDENNDWQRRDRFTFLIIFYMIRRVSDQAKNIGKEAIFSAGVNTKPPRVFPILFLDKDNQVLGPLAKAISEKKFGNCGKFSTVGKTAATAIAPPLVSFVVERLPGVVLDQPKEFNDSINWEDYYIIIGLNQKISDFEPKRLPFHTLALEWNIGGELLSKKSEQNEEMTKEELEKIYRDLSSSLNDLMTRLCGPRAYCE